MGTFDFEVKPLLIGCQSQISIPEQQQKEAYFYFRNNLYFCLQFTSYFKLKQPFLAKLIPCKIKVRKK